ncbi:histone-lysine N-methyltransferase, H3 lysine-79 specific isoform X2 [Teleopsis dalmanni]|uniref:histone-lysine N-methyltransferase, H3 lysine-79 specific isoform X2 n=1 Tax=Teleopsis dalmanni TaxID=139649 RepID=UPI0018CFE5E7|nr:histone-lysine N-methyltransferase, H3 lysine-79 specific isoform X2 [Teleopsis dalmanni]
MLKMSTASFNDTFSPELIKENKENAYKFEDNIGRSNMNESPTININIKKESTANMQNTADALVLNEIETNTSRSSTKRNIQKSTKTSPYIPSNNLDNIVSQFDVTSLNDTPKVGLIEENKENASKYEHNTLQINVEDSSAANITFETDSNVNKLHGLNEIEPSSQSKSDMQQSPNSSLDVTKKLSNIVLEWSFQKQGATQHENASSRLRDLYSYKDIYQKKKEEKLRICIENERKNRQFHSRPVPNFKAAHAKLENHIVHAITVPQSPDVLKHSREMMEKKMNKLEIFKRQQRPPKFEYRSPVVLREEPFVPKKTITVVEQRPFNLQSDKRRQERKHYDEGLEQRMEERRKQKEEESKKREEDRVKELRKLTTFKARPNPFK